MYRYVFIFIILLLGSHRIFAHDYQWSVPVKIISGENANPPVGYLWISPKCDKVRALMFAFQNMNEETLFSSLSFRSKMAENDVAMLWIAPGFGQEWNVDDGIQDVFYKLIDDLAEVSGHEELVSAPLIPFGHSAQATMPWNFAAWNPTRTLCIISYHGDAPRTNLCGYGRSNVEWGRDRNIDGIPGLMVMGEYEWWDARLRPALAFKMMYPASCISFLGDAGRGHFDLSDRTADYIALFIEKSLTARYIDGKLVKVNPENGWLAEQWYPQQLHRESAAPFDKYDGCRHEAFWYFDEEMAKMTEERYNETRCKRMRWLGFVDATGRLLPFKSKAHCKINASIMPDDDDIFVLKAVFTDSLRSVKDAGGDNNAVKIKYISGPAIAVNDSAFRVDRNHPTWNNPRRKGKITLCAEAPADDIYKEVVQEIEVTILK